jgi:hypothetical protein
MQRHAAAEKNFRDALRSRSEFAAAYVRLGDALRGQGKFAAALAAYQEGHKRGHGTGSWPYPSARLIQEAARLVEWERRLPSLLKGDCQPPDAAGHREVAEVCGTQARFVAAVHFAAEALVLDPAGAKDPSTGYRYNAACWATRAANGEGDGKRLDEPARAGLRRKALDWLRADLTEWARRAEAGPPTARAALAPALRLWQQDSDFASVRDPAALANLPDAERAAWQKLWADVEALRRRAAESR